MSPSDSTPSTSQPAASNNAIKPKELFSHQAAKFSAYAPFILLVLGSCVQGQTKAHAGTDVGFQLAVALGGLFFLTTVAAFVLGVVGLFGGIARRATWTIALALAGILLNTGLLALWCAVIIGMANRTRAPLPRENGDELWTKIDVPSPRISFEMPGNPTEDVKSVGNQGQVTVTTYQFFDRVTHFNAMVVNSEQNARLPQNELETARWLDGGLDSWRRSLNGRTVYQESVSLGQLVGREQHFEFDPPAKDKQGRPIVGMAIGKAFLVDKSMVTLTTVLDKDVYEQNSNGVRERISRFFDSLQIQE
jgi:hypothetical protein